MKKLYIVLFFGLFIANFSLCPDEADYASDERQESADQITQRHGDEKLDLEEHYDNQEAQNHGQEMDLKAELEKRQKKNSLATVTLPDGKEAQSSDDITTHFYGVQEDLNNQYHKDSADLAAKHEQEREAVSKDRQNVKNAVENELDKTTKDSVPSLSDEDMKQFKKENEKNKYQIQKFQRQYKEMESSYNQREKQAIKSKDVAADSPQDSEKAKLTGEPSTTNVDSEEKTEKPEVKNMSEAEKQQIKVRFERALKVAGDAPDRLSQVVVDVLDGLDLQKLQQGDPTEVGKFFEKLTEQVNKNPEIAAALSKKTVIDALFKSPDYLLFEKNMPEAKINEIRKLAGRITSEQLRKNKNMILLGDMIFAYVVIFGVISALIYEKVNQ